MTSRLIVSSSRNPVWEPLPQSIKQEKCRVPTVDSPFSLVARNPQPRFGTVVFRFATLGGTGSHLRFPRASSFAAVMLFTATVLHQASAWPLYVTRHFGAFCWPCAGYTAAYHSREHHTEGNDAPACHQPDLGPSQWETLGDIAV